MKKTLALILCLALMCAVLPVGASAAAVMLSPQNLSVDGRDVTCEKYNIDGSNYFKLRDIAYLLMGTDNEFGVGYDEVARSIIVVPGMPYEPVGGELVVGADKSSTAVPSSQTLWFLDAPADGLSVYNIGGNNFFKLRDLGNLIGFEVDYDADTNTAIIRTGAQAPAPAVSPEQQRAFDTLWGWVERNFNDDSIDREYYMTTEADNGEAAMLEIIDTEIGSIALVLSYYYAGGDYDECWIYLERDEPTYYTSYYFYGGTEDPYTPGFRGSLFMDPASFAAGESMEFEYVEGELTGLMDYDFWTYASESVSFTVSWLDDFLRNTPELAGIDIYDFGFTTSALGGEVPDIPQPTPGSEAQAAAYDDLFQWVRANANDTVDGYPAYTHEELLIGAGATTSVSVVAIDFYGEPMLELEYSYQYDNGNKDTAYLFLDSVEQTYYGGYEHYAPGETEPDFFGDFFVDAATFDGNYPMTFDETEGEMVGTDFAVSARYLATYSLCDMLVQFDELCRLTIAPGVHDITDFGLSTTRLSTAELALN